MTTWVLLRGLTRGSGHWATFPDMLQRRLGGPRVVTLDLPGNGALSAQRSPRTIAAMRADCQRQMHALGVPAPYHVLAVSLGGLIAIDWAAHDPASLAACVLVNGSLRGVSPWHQRLRPSSYGRLLRIAAGSNAFQQECAILALTSRDASAADRVIDLWAALRAHQPVSRANALRQLWAAWRYAPPARAPAVPMLVLSSLGDVLVDPRCSASIGTRWTCETAVHPWAGHDLTLDDPAWVADRVALTFPRPSG